MGEAVLKVMDVGSNSMPRDNDFESRKTQELVFAFVEPIGGGSKRIINLFEENLRDTFGYTVNSISISALIESEARNSTLPEPEIPPILSSLGKLSKRAARISRLQQWGNILREPKNDFLARKAIQRISEYRANHDGLLKTGDEGPRVPQPMRAVHMIRSIKHEAELKLLKSLYGDLLFLIAVSGDRKSHINNFRPGDLSDAEDQKRSLEYDALAKIDQDEGIENGQGVRDVFYQADLFLSSKDDSARGQIEIFLDLVFGRRIKSPSDHERMMFEAFAASLRSTCLSRQVGAAISDAHGDLVSIGWNDVPAFGGGLATDEKEESRKTLCKTRGFCKSYKEINNLLKDIFEKLRSEKIISKRISEKVVCRALKDAGLSGLIEFSRAIHAEMEAILSAARTGKIGLRNGTIYVTTYPCDNCVKHILAAGLRQVIYIEPYPKSRAKDFYDDWIAEKENNDLNEKNRLFFAQFTGIAPQAYALLFKKWFKRKDKSGNVQDRGKEFTPITSVYLDSYILYEAKIAGDLYNEQKE